MSLLLLGNRTVSIVEREWAFSRERERERETNVYAECQTGCMSTYNHRLHATGLCQITNPRRIHTHTHTYRHTYSRRDRWTTVIVRCVVVVVH